MSDVNQSFLATHLSFTTFADMSAFDCAGIKDGALAYCREGIANVNDPDNTNRPFFVYDEDSVAGLGATIRATFNSNGGALRGRWVRLTMAPNIAP